MDPNLRRRILYRSLRDEDLTKTRFTEIIPDKEGLYLKKKVFLGYTDISAAGSRTLLGLAVKKIYNDLGIPGLESCEPICLPVNDDIEIPRIPVQLVQCKYEEYSLIIINTALPPSKTHLVADKIIQLCCECDIEKLVVLTTLKMRETHKLAPLYECHLNTRALTDKPLFDVEIKVNDPFLNVLIQMVQIEDIPCNILVAPGHGACTSVPNSDDNSMQAIREFQQFISGWTNLKLDEDLTFQLEYGKSRILRRTGTFMFS